MAVDEIKTMESVNPPPNRFNPPGADRSSKGG